MKFTELDIPANILKALKKMGYEEMTPIQEATYPVIFMYSYLSVDSIGIPVRSA